jgi:hypothetical protein
MADVRLFHSTTNIADASITTFAISVFAHLDVTTDDWLGELTSSTTRGRSSRSCGGRITTGAQGSSTACAETATSSAGRSVIEWPAGASRL